MVRDGRRRGQNYKDREESEGNDEWWVGKNDKGVRQTECKLLGTKSKRHEGSREKDCESNEVF